MLLISARFEYFYERLLFYLERRMLIIKKQIWGCDENIFSSGRRSCFVWEFGNGCRLELRQAIWIWNLREKYGNFVKSFSNHLVARKENRPVFN